MSLDGLNMTRSGHFASRHKSLFQFVQKRLRVLQIGGVDMLGQLCGDRSIGDND